MKPRLYALLDMLTGAVQDMGLMDQDEAKDANDRLWDSPNTLLWVPVPNEGGRVC